jgi:hypothetical protein
LPPGFGTIWLAVAIDLVGFGVVFPILPVRLAGVRCSAPSSRREAWRG